jgi:hypothetical protein
VPSTKTPDRRGFEQVQHQDERAAHDANDEHHGDELARQDQQLGGRIDIPPGMLMPPTVLVTELDNGTLILQGRPDGPRVWLEPDEAAPLKRELAAAFDRFELAAAGSDQGEVR